MNASRSNSGSAVLDRPKRARGESRESSAQFASMVEQVPVNVMFADTNLVIRYMNDTSLKTLKSIQHLLPLPAEQVLGQNIDVFHKDPSRQRRFLSDLKNLPHQAMIELGPEKLDLRVVAVFDDNRQHTGFMVTWSVATERLRLDQENKDAKSLAAAISKSQAIIEFKPDGTVVTANDNFLGALGYRLEEIQGRHHSMFVDTAFVNSPDYKRFWASLANGEYQAGEFKRFAKGGKEIWIQASYNPVQDLSGKTYKVVKYATDVTDQVKMRENMKVITKQMEDVFQKVAENASALAASSSELTAGSTQMMSNAEETSSQANVVAAASEQVSKNVQTVSAAVEELGASVKEIAKNAGDAAKVATTAVTVAKNTNETVSKLGDSSAEIGKVIKVITSIAQQTNLLALNATIEAARAGEAGKGFAVVANEVKELAKETTKATEEISRMIEAIQADTAGAVKAIGEIGGIINQINDFQSTIAGAVEEQAATTGEISRNVSEAARGSQEIAQTISSVAEAAKVTSGAAAEAAKAAEGLSRMSEELNALVSRSKS